ncbi:hypothetical protein FHG87_023686 [Trinorchestia longiramus]|nr:hypothetical protein FHG87_023686 [Trinorchestia longiramus]
MSSREGEQGRGDAGHTARSLLPTPVNTRPPQNNSGYYAITDEAAAVDKLTSFKATELFTKINLKPIIPPDLRAKRTIFIRQLDSSVGKLTPEEISREIKTQQPWAKILEQKLPSNKRTNQHLLSRSQPTHIKLAALVIETHITSLAKTESYGTILSKSLKRNFNIDTSFPDRDFQNIFNLFINPTPDPEPAPIATPNTNTETISTHQDMELESEQSSTETNDTQDQNSDNTEPEQPWETRTKKKNTKKRKKACSPPDKQPTPDTYELEATLVKSATQHPPIPTHPTNDWIITELAKTNPKIKVEIGKGDPTEVWKQIYVNKIHLNQLPIYAIPQQDFDEIPYSPKNRTHKRPKHTT